MNTYRQVGRNSANWTPIFANWIQLANVCQLETSQNQWITELSANWQIGRLANLPTSINHCFKSINNPFQVGNNTPLPTGEVDTPDISRDVYLVLGRLSVVCEVVR